MMTLTYLNCSEGFSQGENSSAVLQNLSQPSTPPIEQTLEPRLYPTGRRCPHNRSGAPDHEAAELVLHQVLRAAQHLGAPSHPQRRHNASRVPRAKNTCQGLRKGAQKEEPFGVLFVFFLSVVFFG